jgi:hypothetical protein
VAADGTPPAAPLSVAATSGGNVQAGTLCSVVTGTRFVNAAGAGSVGVTVTIATPESGESVVLSATTPGSTPVTTTVAASATSVSTTLNVTGLLDGAVTLTARTEDAAGNLSTTLGPTNAIVKDTVAQLSGVTYTNVVLFADQLSGTSECGARVTAKETAPASATFTAPQITTGSTFPQFNVAAVSLGSYSYDVTAVDLAGNTSAVVTVSGSDLL